MRMTFLDSSRSRRRTLSFVAPALLFMTAAGAATPSPAPNIQAAQQAIGNAERLEAGAHAAAELGAARAKLAAAQEALNKKQKTAAAQFADEARADADLAAARTGAIKAKAANDDIKRSTETLIDEMQRKTGENR
jgi:hypothetical protein